MSLLQAIVLGVVQGMTEFLPVSSSAHLILVPRLLGWPDQGLDFDIAAHLGTFLAVLIFFRRDLAQLAHGMLSGLHSTPAEEDRATRRLGWWLVWATAPVAVAGLLLSDWIETTLRSPLVVAATSIGFGLLLAGADLWSRRERDLSSLTLGDSLAIGAAQALALVPGTSRSGITITTARLRGLDRTTAARFSFLLSVPAGFLVAAKDLLDIATGKIQAAQFAPMAVGFLVSAASGYLVIGGLLAWLRRGSLLGFAVYRIALGALILIFWLS
jgi:undecaprenyl-diphosphatase